MMLNREAIRSAVEVQLLTREHFYDPKHQAIWDAILDLQESGGHRDRNGSSVAQELERRGQLQAVGGINYLWELKEYPGAVSEYGPRVRKAWKARAYVQGAHRLRQFGYLLAGGSDEDEIDERVKALITDASSETGAPGGGIFSRLVPGGSFVLDAPDHVPALWGKGNEVFWADGESLMLCGPSGVGKTTLAAQLLAGRLGLMDEVLGYPVMPGERNVLYLAMDRPQQARRALRRLFTPEHRDVLDRRLIVWEGPPPYDMAKNTDTLVRLCENANADTVIVDSLKDAAIGLSDDAIGAGYNRARQAAIVAGVQVLELHHQRKTGANGGPPQTIDDLYGSVWLPNGAGSVIVLWGSPGDSIVQLFHRKQPAEEIGPLQVIHDHNAGISSIYRSTDLVQMALTAHQGITAKDAACGMFETDKPKANEVEKARRKLESLVKSKRLMRRDGAPGGDKGGTPTTYHAALSVHRGGAA